MTAVESFHTLQQTLTRRRQFAWHSFRPWQILSSPCCALSHRPKNPRSSILKANIFTIRWTVRWMRSYEVQRSLEIDLIGFSTNWLSRLQAWRREEVQSVEVFLSPCRGRVRWFPEVIVIVTTMFAYFFPVAILDRSDACLCLLSCTCFSWEISGDDPR